MSTISPLSAFQSVRFHSRPTRMGLGEVSEAGLAPPMLPSPAGPYGITNVGVQSYLPVQAKRPFSRQEQDAIQHGLDQWWPKFFPSYSTTPEELLASPAKSALAAGILGTALGAILTMSHRLPLSILPVLGFLGGGLGYFLRRQHNEDVLDLMHRFPAGATRRDLLSDPVYQAELNRQAMHANNGGGAVALAALNAFSNSSRRNN